ncbi:MAG TPA: zf-HC2 domain-containing protein [Thermoanaerobaculia bacterium]|nr:zf-HC2 domain-containing protein [Thermoanaerobaculia bacterium]
MTIEDDAALREAFAARTGPGPGGPGACPAPQRIYDAARGALPPGEVRDVVEHLAACPECAEAWRLAAALEEEARAGGVADAVAPGADRRPWYLQPVRLAATAALALVAVAVVWTVVQAPEEEPVWRGGELEIRPLLPEGEALPRGEAVLRWTPVPEEDPEGTTYDLRVTTEDVFTSVAEAEGLDEPRYAIPPEALEDLPPGTELLWRVEARLEDGRTVASPTFATPIE